MLCASQTDLSVENHGRLWFFVSLVCTGEDDGKALEEKAAKAAACKLRAAAKQAAKVAKMEEVIAKRSRVSKRKAAVQAMEILTAVQYPTPDHANPHLLLSLTLTYSTT